MTLTEFLAANPVIAHLLNCVGTIIVYYQANKRLPFLRKGNGNGWNGKDRRDYITKGEINPQLDTITNKLGEIREDFKENQKENRDTFKIVFKEIGVVKHEVSDLGKEVGKLQGAHEGK